MPQTCLRTLTRRYLLNHTVVLEIEGRAGKSSSRYVCAIRIQQAYRCSVCSNKRFCLLRNSLTKNCVGKEVTAKESWRAMEVRLGRAFPLCVFARRRWATQWCHSKGFGEQGTGLQELRWLLAVWSTGWRTHGKDNVGGGEGGWRCICNWLLEIYILKCQVLNMQEPVLQGHAAFHSAPRVKVFDLNTYDELETRYGHAVDAASPECSIFSMAASRDGQHVLLSLGNQELQGWSLRAILATTVAGNAEDFFAFPCKTYAGMDQRPARQGPPLSFVAQHFVDHPREECACPLEAAVNSMKRCTTPCIVARENVRTGRWF